MLNEYQSRIIDGEFFPHTLSVGDTILLKLLREIIDVKYLQTTQFTGQVLPPDSLFCFVFNSRILVGLILESMTGVLLTECQ